MQDDPTPPLDDTAFSIEELESRFEMATAIPTVPEVGLTEGEGSCSPDCGPYPGSDCRPPRLDVF